jgi:hypothetical protein
MRGIKRTTVYGPVEQARLERLSARLTKKELQDKEQQVKEEHAMDVEDVKLETENKETMDVDEKKISTSGWRGARNDGYKKKQAETRKRVMVFKKKAKSKK